MEIVECFDTFYEHNSARESQDYGAGVEGWAVSDTGDVYGVFGRSQSISGIGFHGYASQFTGNTCGVYGKSARACYEFRGFSREIDISKGLH